MATRAASELRATGVHRERPDSPDNNALTAQQRQIAELAAAGRSNKQIAERLFLSPRTVGYHLYRSSPSWASPPAPRCATRWLGLPEAGRR